KDDKKEGLYEEWDTYDNPSIEATYKDDQLHGLHEKWDQNDQITTTYYLFGKSVTKEEYETYMKIKLPVPQKKIKITKFSNENLISKKEYSNGKLNGLAEEWYQNGKPKIKANYKDGKKDGL